MQRSAILRGRRHGELTGMLMGSDAIFDMFLLLLLTNFTLEAVYPSVLIIVGLRTQSQQSSTTSFTIPWPVSITANMTACQAMSPSFSLFTRRHDVQNNSTPSFHLDADISQPTSKMMPDDVVQDQEHPCSDTRNRDPRSFAQRPERSHHLHPSLTKIEVSKYSRTSSCARRQ